MENILTEFRGFYSSKFNGRCLQWIHQLSRCDLVGYGFRTDYLFQVPINVRSYSVFSLNFFSPLQVSCFQAAILVLFNERDQLTMEQIENRLDFNQPTLVSNLAHLQKHGLLGIANVTGNCAKFAVNLGFER